MTYLSDGNLLGRVGAILVLVLVGLGARKVCATAGQSAPAGAHACCVGGE